MAKASFNLEDVKNEAVDLFRGEMEATQQQRQDMNHHHHHHHHQLLTTTTTSSGVVLPFMATPSATTTTTTSALTIHINNLLPRSEYPSTQLTPSSSQYPASNMLSNEYILTIWGELEERSPCKKYENEIEEEQEKEEEREGEEKKGEEKKENCKKKEKLKHPTMFAFISAWAVLTALGTNWVINSMIQEIPAWKAVLGFLVPAASSAIILWALSSYVKKKNKKGSKGSE